MNAAALLPTAAPPGTPTLESLLEENALLTQEIQVARRAAEITAQLVVAQFQKLEQMVLRLEEMVAAEQELKEALAEKLRDAEIREKQLAEARQAAEAADEAKGAFLATMSHEIRTPLNAIIGMTNLLLETELNPEQREFVEIARNSGDALLTLINDILDFSKIGAGKMELENQPFDLCQCIESALDLVANKAAEKGIELSVFIDAHTPGSVVGDVTRFRQIVVNLLSNAVKFTEEGEVAVTVSAKELERDEGDWYEIRVDVRDTGIGIPADRQDRLFDAFTQADASATRQYGGTGLGLAISKRLAELLGGAMWVESEVGKGSTFSFTIQARSVPEAKPLYLAAEQPHLRDKRLLIVDDNATNRKILMLQTQSWGMSPVPAASGAEALDLLRRGERFDLAALDMHMPEMDGVTLAQEIKRLLGDRGFPLVMLTSLGIRDASIPADLFASFLTKPVKASQLYNTLIQVLANETQVVEPERRKSAYDPELGRKHPLRVLVAEDNVINQKLILVLLERLGYRADVVANGQEALDAIQRQGYDVVLMDVQMPEMDGLTATRRIRENMPDERQPRIIAMTANAMPEDRRVCLDAGMDDYLAKPIQVEAVTEALLRAEPVDRKAAAAEATDQPTPAAPKSEAEENGTGETDASQERKGPTEEESDVVVDPTALRRLKETLGDQAEALLPMLVEEFVSNSEKLLQDARDAAAAGKLEELRRAAHTLKSNGANFGATKLAEAARTLENLAKEGATAGADELIEACAVEFARAARALTT